MSVSSPLASGTSQPHHPASAPAPASSTASNLRDAAFRVVKGAPDVFMILAQNGVLFSPWVSKGAKGKFISFFPELHKLSMVLFKAVGATGAAEGDLSANLPNLSALFLELKFNEQFANPTMRVQRCLHVLKNLAQTQDANQALPDDLKKWLVNFANSFGLLNLKTNPLFQLGSEKISQLNKHFPVSEDFFSAPLVSLPLESFEALDSIPRLSVAIKLAELKIAFLNDPVLMSFRRLTPWLKYDSDVCLAAVKKCGFALQHVPEALRTEAICLAAVEQDGFALLLVPEALRTEAVCLAAVEQDGQVLLNVPEALRTETVCLAAVRQDGQALECVPQALMDEVKAFMLETDTK